MMTTKQVVLVGGIVLVCGLALMVVTLRIPGVQTYLSFIAGALIGAGVGIATLPAFIRLLDKIFQ